MDGSPLGSYPPAGGRRFEFRRWADTACPRYYETPVID